MTVEVRPLAGEEEARQAFDVLRRAFNYPRDDEDRWVASVGPLERTRAVFVDARVASVARVRPFGQFFGGRRVPLGGFSPVGTAPEYRGRGYAQLVTIAHFEAQRERGEVLSLAFSKATRAGSPHEEAEDNTSPRSRGERSPPTGVFASRAAGEGSSLFSSISSLHRRGAWVR